MFHSNDGTFRSSKSKGACLHLNLHVPTLLSIYSIDLINNLFFSAKLDAICFSLQTCNGENQEVQTKLLKYAFSSIFGKSFKRSNLGDQNPIHNLIKIK